MPLGRIGYFAWGFGLMLFKYLVEYALVHGTSGGEYGPLMFVSPLFTSRIEAIRGAGAWVPMFILLWSFPFVALALFFTVRRLIDAGYSPWLSLWILFPVINFVLMLVLCLLPSTSRTLRATEKEGESTSAPIGVMEWLVSLAIGLVLTVAVLMLSILFLGDYGVAAFFIAPVFLGATSGYVQTRRRGCDAREAILMAVGTMLLGMAILVATAFEGIICIVMALPIMLPAVMLGGYFGHLFARNGDKQGPWMTAVLVLPGVSLVEHWTNQPVVYEVESSVVVNASPEEVWPVVIAFPEITRPPGWLFRLGVACPVRARIEGTGPGATRYCDFSTGSFVEPITAWDAPHHLAFSVTRQPCPMTELSPWGAIHPPHLDGYLRSERGEFRLVPLPGGRTRLEGSTWYSVDMYPQLYWKQWSDTIIHAIHLRVLGHIRETVEGGKL